MRLPFEGWGTAIAILSAPLLVPYLRQVWQLDLASSHLKTMTSQSQIQSRQIRPILVQVYGRANGCGAKNYRVSIPWDANPPFPVCPFLWAAPPAMFQSLTGAPTGDSPTVDSGPARGVSHPPSCWC